MSETFGLTQAEARRRAKRLGGIAVEARKRTGHWLLGGWASQKDAVWIVVSIDRVWILDDGTA